MLEREGGGRKGRWKEGKNSEGEGSKEGSGPFAKHFLYATVKEPIEILPFSSTTEPTLGTSQ